MTMVYDYTPSPLFAEDLTLHRSLGGVAVSNLVRCVVYPFTYHHISDISILFHMAPHHVFIIWLCKYIDLPSFIYSFVHSFVYSFIYLLVLFRHLIGWFAMIRISSRPGRGCPIAAALREVAAAGPWQQQVIWLWAGSMSGIWALNWLNWLNWLNHGGFDAGLWTISDVGRMKSGVVNEWPGQSAWGNVRASGRESAKPQNAHINY